MSSIQNGKYREVPPQTSGLHQTLNNTVDASAENYDWVGALGSDAPSGSVYLTLEAMTQDIYVRFKPTNAAAATTTSNGFLLKAGVAGGARRFYVSPTKHRYIDCIAGGAGGVLKVYVSSQIVERENV